MNLILAGLLLFLFTGYLPAQETAPLTIQERERLPYKAKSTFNRDTLQFLEYNFTNRSVQYKEKKVSDVLKDLDLPVLFIEGPCVASEIQEGIFITKVRSLSLVVHQAGEKPSELEDYYIILFFAEPFTLAEYREISGSSRENPNSVLTQKLYDFLKDRTVSDVSSNRYIIEKRENLKKAGNKN